MQQAQSHIQSLRRLCKRRRRESKERIKAASAENVARINATSRQDVEELKGWIAMLTQQMQPPPALQALQWPLARKIPALCRKWSSKWKTSFLTTHRQQSKPLRQPNRKRQ